MRDFSRRDFLKITAVAGGGLAGTYLLSKSRFSQPIIISDTRVLMGTIIHLKVVCFDEEEGKTAVNATYAAIERLVNMFNWRTPASYLGILNAEGELADVPTDLVEVISQALKYGEMTNGAFDVTIQPVLSQIKVGKPVHPEISRLVDYRKVLVEGNKISYQQPGMQITLDGIAKGFVVDRGVETLKQLGFDRVLVEAGGDMGVSGIDADGQGWKIGVASPRPENMDGYLAVFSISQGAVATSGDYMNWYTVDKSSHHIIDPASLLSPSELASVTVWAPTAMEADALSTAIMVMGSEAGLELANQLDAVEAMIVTKDMVIRRTKGFPSSS